MFLNLSGLSIVSLNTRGLRNNVKRKALFLFAKQFRSDFFFAQESHSIFNDTNFWRTQWGDTIWLAHGTERSAGVVTFKNRFNGDILVTECDENGHFVCQVIRYSDITIIMGNIYGYNTKTENDNLISSIENILSGWLVQFPNAIICVGGDFNNVLDGGKDKWPSCKSYRPNANFQAFMDRFDLEDTWRAKYPNNRSFTWSNKTGSSQSRIDFWLISRNINKEDIEVDILPTPLTDHKAILIKLKLSSSNNRPQAKSTYWKLNSSLLENKEVQKEASRLISHFWAKAKNERSFGNNWELLKFELGKYFRKFGALLAKSRRAEETNIVSEITQLLQKSPGELTEQDKLDLSNLQTKLDELYSQKAKGAFIRSRTKWLEEGEQNSHYFFNLEKHRSNNNTINKLNINGTTTDDHKMIASYCSDFYKTLYTSDFCHMSAETFLSSLTVNPIDHSNMEFCDAPVALEEIKKVITLLKNNKSPGTDGLIAEFYKEFTDELAPFLYEVLVECIEKEHLPVTMTQGLITLILKPNKDCLCIENWRPICLLNNDYKIFALIFARRLKNVLNSIIEETQSGFMPGRHITNNIRLVLDIIDYPDLIYDNGYILFLDFRKAFDTVEHPFIFQSLKKFGFGRHFTTAIKTLYRNSNCSIKLTNGTSPRFDLSRGLRQGCPASPYLFLIVAQLLAEHIKSGPVKGISLVNRNLVITQLADDTTLFLQDDTQVPIALEAIKIFSKASGLYLNINKCELMAIKECSKSTLHGIPIKNEVTYLGIKITKDQHKRTLSNFKPILLKAQKRFNFWLLRDLSLRGRVLLAKAEGLSRLTYAALALHIDNKLLKEIDNIIFNFLWKNRTHYLKKTVVMNSYENGGLNVLDFCTLNNMFKLNWLKQFFMNPSSIWNVIPQHHISQMGGLGFFLVCNYNIDKIPVKLSAFHRQTFLAWSLIFKHNFSPHKYYLWNNKDILYKHKSLFLKYWFENNIIWVDQLFNREGILFSYKDFLAEYGIPVTPGDYAKVFGAIPPGVCMLFKAQPRINPSQMSLLNPLCMSVGKICFSKTPGNNRHIRALLQKDVTSRPYVITFWSNFVDNIAWKKVWLLPNRYLITNKVKEVSFKMIHRIYPVKVYIEKRFKKDIDVNCSFCGSCPETLLHLFWECPIVKEFWCNLCLFIVSNIDTKFLLYWENVLFGLAANEGNVNAIFLINLLIIMAKFYIHKSKFLKKMPCIIAFHNEFKHYICSLKYSTKPKAMKTFTACVLFKVYT